MNTGQRGFTLIEVTVTVLILGLLVSTGYGMLTVGLKAWDKGSRSLEMRQNLRIGMEKMVWEIRQGKNHQISRIGDINHYQIVFDMNGNKIEYQMRENELRRSVNGAGNNPVAEHISALNFAWDDERRSIVITLTAAIGNETTVLQTTVNVDKY